MLEEVKEEPKSINEQCARVATALMEHEQQAISMQKMYLDELQQLYNQSGREDILEFIEDLKEQQLGDEPEHWALDNEWFKYFEGIETKVAEEEQSQELAEGGGEITEIMEE